MLRALILTIFLIPISWASANDTCSQKIDLESQMSLFEKAVYRISLHSRHKANPREAKFFAHNLLLSFAMQDLVLLATHHSQILCGPKWIDNVSKKKETEDNEVDAIRHFVLSTLLGYYYPDKALPILFNHEINGKRPLNERNLMDLHNNQSGIQFAEALKATNSKLSQSEVAYLAVEQALRLLKRRELKLLGNITHGPCASLEQKPDKEIDLLIEKHRRDFDLMQRSCIGPALDCGIQ